MVSADLALALTAAPPGAAASAAVQGFDDVLSVVIMALPVSVGVAILRYRLYDIDRIISRTMAYTIVTGLLAGLYAGLVLLATRGLSLHAPVAVAAATLAAAAVFNPLRRAQLRVDQRFNRARNDADRTVTALATRLKDTVHPALKPAHVSVWVSDAGSPGHRPGLALSCREARAAATSRHRRLTAGANATRSRQDHLIAAQLPVHRVAVVDSQSLENGKGKDRYPAEDGSALRSAAEHRDADNGQYDTGEREPGPPVSTQGAREAGTMRFSRTRIGHQAWYNGGLATLPHAHQKLRSSGRNQLEPVPSMPTQIGRDSIPAG